MADVKVIRGAEASSDHHLVFIKVNLRWSRQEKVLRNEGNRPRLRLKKLMDWGVRVSFQTELGKFFEKASDCGGEDVEEAWKEFKGAVLGVTERVVGRQRVGKHRKVTSWWSSDVKEAVKRKKWLYRKALNDKTDKSWKLYKEVRKIVYLGVKLSEDGKMGSEVERRIGMIMQTVGAMKKVHDSREISREAKVTVFEAVAIPALTYGCESCVLTNREGKV